MNFVRLNCIIGIFISFISAKCNIQFFDIESVSKKYNISKEIVEKQVELAQKSMQPIKKFIEIVVGSEKLLCQITRQGVGILETKHGIFCLYDFKINDFWGSYYVLVKASFDDDFVPQFKNHEQISLRIDSGCLTGQLFGDLTCECKDQLDEAMKLVNLVGEGIIICIPAQDGRGMGLAFKLGTLSLQH